MKLEDFLKLKQTEVLRYIKTKAPRVIGTIAVNEARRNFEREGYQDTALSPWKASKRKNDPKKSVTDQTRKTLTGTGDLKDSIRYDLRGDDVVISSDLDYAAAHNNGTTNAGRGNKTKLPQRQFLGKSNDTKRKIIKKLERDITKIQNK
jgi:phage gpG-like protein